VRTIRVILGAVGLAVIAYAITGLLTDDGVRVLGVLTFMVGLVVAHDLVVMPIALGIGALATRFVPAWGRPFVHGGLWVSAAVTAFALPFVIGAGRTADNPSKLPRPYGEGLAITLGLTWLIVAVLVLRAKQRRRTLSGRPGTP
jgi:hypothetical protein